MDSVAPVGSAPPADSPAESPTDTAPVAPTLDLGAWAIRASLDLRGVRPGAAELAQATDEAAVEALIAQWVQDERFATRAAWIWNERVHSALFFESTTIRSWQDLSTSQRRLLGWEPLELVRAVVAGGRPFSEVVTATALPTHPEVAAVWGWEVPGGEGWSLAGAPDTRPAAGMLSSSSLWFVYDGDPTNYNRRRANAVSRLFLCEDFLAREVSLDATLSVEDLADMEDAVSTVPSCQACHAGMDPLAALFGGFAERSFEGERSRVGRYSPWMADWYLAWTPPAYFGHPVASLTELGAALASDRRFARCTARTLAEGLLAEVELEPAQLEVWTEVLLSSGLDLRALAEEITRSEPYRRAEERTLGVEVLASALADFLALEPEEVEDLAWDLELRVLAGGTDDTQILEPNRVPGLGHQVVLAWAARQFVGPALARDEGRDTQQLWVVEPWTTDPAEVRVQLEGWMGRWLGPERAADPAAVDRLVALWEATGGAEDPVTAWESALQALLRHPQSLVY